MEHAVVDGLGFAHFLTQTDSVGRIVLGTLLILSLASWYLIVTRTLANTLAQRRADAFLKRFWQASSLSEVETTLGAHAADKHARNSHEHGRRDRQGDDQFDQRESGDPRANRPAPRSAPARTAARQSCCDPHAPIHSHGLAKYVTKRS